MTATEILREIEKAIGPEASARDPDWLTAKEWAKEWGKSESHTGAILRRAVESGIVQTRKDSIPKMDGSMYPTPVYKFVGKK